MVVVILALTHRHNLVRGHETDSTECNPRNIKMIARANCSGERVEKCLRRFLVGWTYGGLSRDHGLDCGYELT